MFRNHLIKLVCIFLVIVMLVLPFMSCTGKEEEKIHVLKIACLSQPSTDNPFKAAIGSSDSQHFQMMYEPLVYIIFDSGPQPGLAKSWTYDASNMTWTLKINPNAKFSDGTKVTAQDAEWTLEKAVELNVGMVSTLIPILATDNPINATDSETLTIKLKTFSATFIRLLGDMSIVPKARWAGMNNEQIQTFANPDPVGSGAYRLRERVANSHVIYDLRPDYWGGKIEIDEVQHIWFATLESILLAVKQGDVDSVSTFNLPSAIPQLLGDPNITVFQVFNNTTDSFYVNQRFEPWNLAVVRRAASLAINRQEVISLALQGWGSIPVMLERDATFADVEANYNDIKWPGLAYSTQAQRVAEANKMLDGILGMTTIAGGDGTYRKYNGKLIEIKLECSTNIAVSVTQAEQVAANLKEIGIKVTVFPENSSILIGKVSRQTSDATATGWQAYIFGRSYSPDYDYFCQQWQWASTTDPLRFTRRSWIVGWTAYPQGEAISKEFAQIQTMPEGDPTRDALIKKTMKEFADELPAIPLDNRITPCLHRNDRFTGWIQDNGYLYYGQVMPMVTIYNIKNLKPIVTEQ